METYLLDTNVISDLATDGGKGDSPCALNFRVAAASGARVLLPVIGIAEIEFGLQKGGNPDSKEAQEIRKFCDRYRSDGRHLPFNFDTIEPYALIRAWLFNKYGTLKGQRAHAHREKLPEELKERSTGRDLGIDERDLMIASAAIQYGCVLVTDDRNEGMRRICEAAAVLHASGKPTELRVTNWRQVP